jgi:hypothetical protein
LNKTYKQGLLRLTGLYILFGGLCLQKSILADSPVRPGGPYAPELQSKMYRFMVFGYWYK